MLYCEVRHIYQELRRDHEDPSIAGRQRRDVIEPCHSLSDSAEAVDQKFSNNKTPDANDNTFNANTGCQQCRISFVATIIEYTKMFR